MMETFDIAGLAAATLRYEARDSADLIELFAQTFRASERTELVRGAGEPTYLPADADHPFHRIVFAHGFFASGLHEIAHWCVAGPARRLQVDFGYWYKPDGRTAAEQREFERVEVKPQALEWTFAVAAGTQFYFSADNLAAGGGAGDSWLAFQANVARQAAHYATHGLPARAARFAAALAARYGTGARYRDLAQFQI